MKNLCFYGLVSAFYGLDFAFDLIISPNLDEKLGLRSVWFGTVFAKTDTEPN